MEHQFTDVDGQNISQIVFNKNTDREAGNKSEMGSTNKDLRMMLHGAQSDKPPPHL